MKPLASAVLVAMLAAQATTVGAQAALGSADEHAVRQVVEAYPQRGDGI